MRLIEQWINKSEVTNLTQVSNLYQCIISRSIIGRKQEAKKYMQILQCVNSYIICMIKNFVNLHLRDYVYSSRIGHRFGLLFVCSSVTKV